MKLTKLILIYHISMNTFIRHFEWPKESFSILYHAIDYVLSLSHWYIIIRWGGGGWLMDRSTDWIRVKQILSDIVQYKPISKEIKQTRLKNKPVILSDEHGNPWTEWYITFEKIAWWSWALKIRIKNLVDKKLTYDQTIVLCSPQRDLFEKNNMIDDHIIPLVFATKIDIDHILILVQAIDTVQSMYYPDFKV